MYEIFCDNCEKNVTGINNFFCVMNRGKCETCLYGRKEKKRKIDFDPFARWRNARRKDELVDNS